MGHLPSFLRWANPVEVEPDVALADLERSTAPDALMSLFIRIQTFNGPRTVIASGVTVASAVLIGEVLAQAGHHVEFVDQCASRDTVRERVLRKKLEKLPKLAAFDRTARHADQRSPAAARSDQRARPLEGFALPH
ncbi:MAG TPA: hypothetical protein VN685_06075 [Rhizomicrobium sp.]|nr:hypothetical protein [Rhizomicrobium sp.]